jgi:ketosteroid isomerase-like protein
MKLALTAAALFLATPAMAQSVKASIDQANETFVADFAKGDAASLAAHYTPRATILPPGAPMMKGRKNIEAFWKQAMGSLTNLKLQALDVQSLGAGTAREIGTFTADAGQQAVVGKYVVIWKKVGKSWRLDTDIWNTDK